MKMAPCQSVPVTIVGESLYHMKVRGFFGYLLISKWQAHFNFITVLQLKPATFKLLFWDKRWIDRLHFLAKAAVTAFDEGSVESFDALSRKYRRFGISLIVVLSVDFQNENATTTTTTTKKQRHNETTNR